MNWQMNFQIGISREGNNIITIVLKVSREPREPIIKKSHGLLI